MRKLLSGLFFVILSQTCHAQMPVFEQVMGEYSDALEVVENIDSYYLTDPAANPADHLRWIVFDRPKALADLTSAFLYLQVAAMFPPNIPTHALYVSYASSLVDHARSICKPHGG